MLLLWKRRAVESEGVLDLVLQEVVLFFVSELAEELELDLVELAETKMHAVAEDHFLGVLFEITLVFGLFVFFLVTDSVARAASCARFCELELLAFVLKQLLLVPFIEPIYVLVYPIVHSPKSIYTMACGLKLLHLRQEVGLEFEEDVSFLMHVPLVAETEVQLPDKCVGIRVQKVLNSLFLTLVLHVLVLFLYALHFVFDHNVLAALQAHTMHRLCVIDIDVAIVNH